MVADFEYDRRYPVYNMTHRGVSKNNLPLGHNRQEGGGAEYIITKDRIALKSPPYAPSIRALFFRGRNSILFRISTRNT